MMQLKIPPPLQGLACGLAMLAVSRFLPQFAVSFPGQIVLTGIFVCAGLAIEFTALGSFIKAKTTVNPLAPEKASKLVVSGLYRFSRNPMYLGLALLLTGLALYLGNLLNAGLLAGFILYITHFQIKPEERILAEKFSADYRDYCARVRRWI